MAFASVTHVHTQKAASAKVGRTTENGRNNTVERIEADSSDFRESGADGSPMYCALQGSLQLVSPSLTGCQSSAFPKKTTKYMIYMKNCTLITRYLTNRRLRRQQGPIPRLE